MSASRLLKSTFRSVITRVSPWTMLKIDIRRQWAFEKEVCLFKYLIPKGKLAVDVGANFGMMSYYILKHTNRVTAFEPNPFLAARLRRTFKNKVAVKELALSDYNGQVTMYIPQKGGQLLDMLGSLEKDSVEANDLFEVKVQAARFDDLGLDGVGFIKIDVEGHELSVLRGAKETLRTHRPCLLIEAEESHRKSAISSTRDFLAEFDYQGFFLLNEKLVKIEKFVTELYQTTSTTGSGPSQMKRVYINNFIFIPKEMLGSLHLKGISY